MYGIRDALRCIKRSRDPLWFVPMVGDIACDMLNSKRISSSQKPTIYEKNLHDISKIYGKHSEPVVDTGNNNNKVLNLHCLNDLIEKYVAQRHEELNENHNVKPAINFCDEVLKCFTEVDRDQHVYDFCCKKKRKKHADVDIPFGEGDKPAYGNGYRKGKHVDCKKGGKIPYVDDDKAAYQTAYRKSKIPFMDTNQQTCCYRNRKHPDGEIPSMNRDQQADDISHVKGKHTNDEIPFLHGVQPEYDTCYGKDKHFDGKNVGYREKKKKELAAEIPIVEQQHNQQQNYKLEAKTSVQGAGKDDLQDTKKDTKTHKKVNIPRPAKPYEKPKWLKDHETKLKKAKINEAQRKQKLEIELKRKKSEAKKRFERQLLIDKHKKPPAWIKHKHKYKQDEDESEFYSESNEELKNDSLYAILKNKLKKDKKHKSDKYKLRDKVVRWPAAIPEPETTEKPPKNDMLTPMSVVSEIETIKTWVSQTNLPDPNETLRRFPKTIPWQRHPNTTKSTESINEDTLKPLDILPESESRIELNESKPLSKAKRSLIKLPEIIPWQLYPDALKRKSQETAEHDYPKPINDLPNWESQNEFKSTSGISNFTSRVNPFVLRKGTKSRISAKLKRRKNSEVHLIHSSRTPSMLEKKKPPTPISWESLSATSTVTFDYNLLEPLKPMRTHRSVEHETEQPKTVSNIKIRRYKLKKLEKKKSAIVIKPNVPECSCAICVFMNRRNVEQDTPLIKEMKARQEKFELQQYYLNMRQKELENCTRFVCLKCGRITHKQDKSEKHKRDYCRENYLGDNYLSKNIRCRGDGGLRRSKRRLCELNFGNKFLGIGDCM